MQYYIEMSGADEGIGVFKIEYTTNGGSTWVVEETFTGTVADPLVSLEGLTQVKNESGKDRVYRWRCHAYTSGTVPCYLSRHIDAKATFADGLVLLSDDEAPASGTDGDGAGFAGPGSIYIDTDSGLIYRNDGNAAMPIWTTL